MNEDLYTRRHSGGEYYPHIDGIRSLAIIPVVLYHLLPALCPGGFVGVDIFFVISGYLITGGIKRDLENERFSIFNFYYRRIRRIMPAYFVMITAVCIVGCFLYYATPLMYLADAVVAGTLFIANYHFWMIGGDYFSPQMHSQPLLHLWSLSVEEQFYLVVPMFCALIWKVRRQWLLPLLFIIAIISFAYASLEVINGRQHNAFYFLHFRAWELLVGSLLAMASTHFTWGGQKDTAKKNITAIVCSIVGLVLIFLSFVSITELTPFPGLTALPAVLGTALLIRFGNIGGVSKVLSGYPLVSIGKISYSLYLWHWPVIIFWKYATYGQFYFLDYVGMLTISLIMAWLSWKFIEMPFRMSPILTKKRAFVATAFMSLLLITIGTLCVAQKGCPHLIHRKANEWRCEVPRDPFLKARMNAVLRRVGAVGEKDWLRNEREQQLAWKWNSDLHIGVDGDHSVFIVGDSHAGTLRYGLDKFLRSEQRGARALSCPVVRGEFEARSRVVIESLKMSPETKIVLIAGAWAGQFGNYFNRKECDIVWAKGCFEEFVREIRSLGKAVVIVSDVPCYEYDPSDIATRMQIITPRIVPEEWDFHRLSEEKHTQMQGTVNLYLQDLCRETGSSFAQSHDALKVPGGYKNYIRIQGRPVALYSDKHHLSVDGSVLVVEYLAGHIKSVLETETGNSTE